MKRLLAVSWEMPPMYGPRATQVARTLGALVALGWQSTVVCLAPRRGGPHWADAAPFDSPAGVDLLRVQSPEEWTMLRAAWRIAPALRDYPDTKRVWVGPATRAALAAAAAGKPAGLVTFAQPWSDHLVGLRVHREAALPWVAHFSDPWVDSPYATARQQAIWRRLEAEVVRDATALVFVSEETAELVMRKYPDERRQKVSVVPQGFDARTAAAGASPRRAGPLRIVYTGRFYAGVRTPLSLLRALALLNAAQPLAGTLELTFVGPHVDAFARDATALDVGSLVRFRGRVPPAEAAAAAADADVLLVIDAPSAGPSVFLPSKLIDYLPFRKPMLGVTPEPGATAALLRRLGCPVAPPDDIAAIAAALADLVRQSRAATLGVSESFDRVAAEFEIGRIAARFNDVLIRAFER
jgi:glycosyltransferase involved in cell wall biosynthesis